MTGPAKDIDPKTLQERAANGKVFPPVKVSLPKCHLRKEIGNFKDPYNVNVAEPITCLEGEFKFSKVT